MKIINNRIGKLSAIAFTGIALTFPATASPDERFEDYEPPRPGYGGEYHLAEPFKVYVSIRDRGYVDRHTDYRDRRHNGRQVRPRRSDTIYTDIAMRKLSYELSGDIILVDNPSYADMVVKVRQTSFNMDFRVTDVDRKDKKYKKSRRFTGGRCGVHHRAYYTRVEERGEANAYYTVKLDVKGFETRRDDFRLRNSEKFRYGKDLTASTNCGVRPTHHLPSNGVEKLFAQSNPGYRHHVVDEIQRETAEDLGRKLAREIRRSANRYFSHIHQHRDYGAYHQNSYEYKDKKADWVSFVARVIID